MPTVEQGIKFNNIVVVDLINQGRTRAISLGATSSTSTDDLLRIFISNFDYFYKAVRDDFAPHKKIKRAAESRPNNAPKVRSSNSPSTDDAAAEVLTISRAGANKQPTNRAETLDLPVHPGMQCRMAQEVIKNAAVLIQIIKHLRERKGEQAYITAVLYDATTAFPHHIMESDFSDQVCEKNKAEFRRDYKIRRANLPTIATYYSNICHWHIPQIIEDRLLHAKIGPAGIVANIGLIKLWMEEFIASPANEPFAPRDETPLLQQPHIGLVMQQQQQQQQARHTPPVFRPAFSVLKT